MKTNLLEWLKGERNLLQNTGSLMWLRPEEQRKTLEVAGHLDKAIQYIELSIKEGNFKPEPLHPVKSLQEIKDELAQKDGYAHWSEYITIQKDAFHIPELLNTADTAAELYASQFKTPPVQEDQNLLSVISDLGAWINQEIDITEGQGKLFKESKNRDMAARCDSSIRTYQKVIRRIEELKSKYTIIPKQ